MARRVKETKDIVTELQMIFKLANLDSFFKFRGFGNIIFLGIKDLSSYSSILSSKLAKETMKNQGLKMIDMSGYEYIFIIDGHKKKLRKSK